MPVSCLKVILHISYLNNVHKLFLVNRSILHLWMMVWNRSSAPTFLQWSTLISDNSITWATLDPGIYVDTNWHKPTARTLLHTRHTPHGTRTHQWHRSPSRTMCAVTPWNSSGTDQRIWQRAEDVHQAQKHPTSKFYWVTWGVPEKSMEYHWDGRGSELCLKHIWLVFVGQRRTTRITGPRVLHWTLHCSRNQYHSLHLSVVLMLWLISVTLSNTYQAIAMINGISSILLASNK